MNRIIQATLLALSALACGGADTGYSREGIEIDCDFPDHTESQFASLPGYDPQGCTRTERMFDVKPFSNDEDSDQVVVGELGELKQPITVLNGQGAATPVNISNNKVSSFRGGGCPADPAWTTAQPVLGNCLIPNHVDIQWRVCPSCYSAGDLQYTRFRVQDAWAVWDRSVSCDGTTITPTIKSGAASEETDFSTATENYDAARVPIYPRFGSSISARAEIDNDLVVAKTPIRNGIRYWAWDYSGISIDHQVIESVKYPACVSTTDPNGALKMKRGYQWIIAHEFGHLFGMPHTLVAGALMRKASDVSCGELFSAASTAPAMTAATFSERRIVAGMRDSSGFSVTGGQFSCSGAPTFSSLTPDDQAVVSF